MRDCVYACVFPESSCTMWAESWNIWLTGNADGHTESTVRALARSALRWRLPPGESVPRREASIIPHSRAWQKQVFPSSHISAHLRQVKFTADMCVLKLITLLCMVATYHQLSAICPLRLYNSLVAYFLPIVLTPFLIAGHFHMKLIRERDSVFFPCFCQK